MNNSRDQKTNERTTNHAHEFYGAVHNKKNSIDIERLVDALQGHLTVDMDEQACSEVRAGLDAYYKVSM